MREIKHTKNTDANKDRNCDQKDKTDKNCKEDKDCHCKKDKDGKTHVDKNGKKHTDKDCNCGNDKRDGKDGHDRNQGPDKDRNDHSRDGKGGQTDADSTCKTGSFNDQFLCLINAHRKANGKNALAYDTKLNEAAENHSAWMQENDNFSHTGENGSQFYQRCEAVGGKCDAENIAYGFKSAQDLFDMWKNSSGHNANMLGDHTVMGLGIAGKYATNDFR
jgi:hypothetical protein